jgi:O-acetyl-ADP-ribose deacetylase (regulator of RNase III)
MHQYCIGEDKLPDLIINFPTKIHWKDPSYYNNIKFGLKSLVKIIKECNIKSIAIPKLGCGCGGLDWDEVKKIIEEEMNCLSGIEILIYEN